MIKKIELTSDYARLLNKEPFIMPDELVFLFTSVGYDLSNAFLTLQNGETKAKFKLEKKMTIDRGLLHSGKLCAHIDAYIDGEKYKFWDLLPIKIIESDNQEVKAFDMLNDLEERLKALEDKHKIIL